MNGFNGAKLCKCCTNPGDFGLETSPFPQGPPGSLQLAARFALLLVPSTESMGTQEQPPALAALGFGGRARKTLAGTQGKERMRQSVVWQVLKGAQMVEAIHERCCALGIPSTAVPLGQPLFIISAVTALQSVLYSSPLLDIMWQFLSPPPSEL